MEKSLALLPLPGRMRLKGFGRLAAATFAGMAAFQLPANAKTHFHVKNCGAYAISYSTFNGHDKSLLIPYKTGIIGHKDASLPDARYHLASCAKGETCKLIILPQHFDNHPKKVITINGGQYIRIVKISKEELKYQYLPGIYKYKSSPIMVYTISDHEEACTDSARNPMTVRH